MYGRRPAWRTLEPDISNGTDVRQLEENLLLLGYTRKGDEIDRHWDYGHDGRREALAAATRSDGGRRDRARRGRLPARGDPGHRDRGDDGHRVGPGGALLSATSNRRVVSVDLDADERDLLEVGATVDGRAAGRDDDRRHRRRDRPRRGVVSPTDRAARRRRCRSRSRSPTPRPARSGRGARRGDGRHARSRENVLTVPVNALLALHRGRLRGRGRRR